MAYNTYLLPQSSVNQKFEYSMTQCLEFNKLKSVCQLDHLPFWRLWAWNCFQIQADSWQNSVSSCQGTGVLVLLLLFFVCFVLFCVLLKANQETLSAAWGCPNYLSHCPLHPQTDKDSSFSHLIAPLLPLFPNPLLPPVEGCSLLLWSHMIRLGPRGWSKIIISLS